MGNYIPDNDSVKSMVGELKRLSGYIKLPEKGWLKEAVKDVKEWMPTVSEGNGAFCVS